MSSAPRGRPAAGSGQEYTTGSQEYTERQEHTTTGRQDYPAGTTAYPQQSTGYQGTQAQPRYEDERDGGGLGAWTGSVLAGVLMILAGLYGFLAGLAIIIHGGFFVYHGNYAYHWTRTGWGWTELILGAVVFFAGVCVMLGMVWARIVGIVLATFSALASFMFLPFYPLWSIITIAVDVFIIWALASSGRRRHYA